MSDSTKSPVPVTAPAASISKFSDREIQILSWAMQSLKSGPPEIDNEKLAGFAGMTNSRSAGNAWAAIKKKLMAPADPNAPPTPKRAGGRKKKETDNENGEATPKKTPRKRTAKEPEDGDASPKKKGRPTKPKPKPEQDTEDEDFKVKPEPDFADSNDLKPKVEEEEEEV